MSSDLEHLLAHSGWIRGLARHLARDGQTADDLVQDAWVVALRHGPSDGTPLRRWAASVLRNLARQKRRGDGRRSAHEERAARSDELPPDGLPDALVERLDEQEALAAAVRGLDEPYRAAILLRYYEGLSPGEIATRTGTPLRTVHTRLNRALHRLRAKLGTERDGRTWSILAMPWLGALRESPPAALLGGLLVKTKIEIALACAAVVGVAALGTWWVQQPAERAPALAGAQVVEQQLELPTPETAIAREPSVIGERAAAGVPEPSASEPMPAAAELPPTNGVVIDAHGAGVTGVDVAFTASREARRAIVATDGQGRFAFDESLPTGELTIATEGWTTVLKPMLWPTNRSEGFVLVVARSRDLAGIVVDVSGATISDAEVELRLPQDLRVELGLALEFSAAEHWRTTSDELGRFELSDVPDVTGSSLLVSKPGYRAASREAPSSSAYDLELVLEDGDATRLIRGTVVDTAGDPVRSAYVALGWSGTRTDEQGAFALELPRLVAVKDNVYGEPDRLWVVADGLLPASVQRRGRSNAAPDAWPDPLRIVLDGEPLSIAGRVVDADDEPVAGARVSSVDKTPFGGVHDDEDGGSFFANVESLATGHVADVFTMTGEDGTFELGGLLEREYRLSALDQQSLGFACSDPIAAGSNGVVLRMPPGEDVPLVAGRVVGLDGTPLPDALVILERDCALPDGTHQGVEGDQSNRTDAEGRFAIRGLKAVPDRVQVRGGGSSMNNKWEIPETADLADLEVVIVRACRFQVDLEQTGTARWFEVLDADGLELDLISFEGDTALMNSTWRLVDGRTEVLSVSELARTLVLRGTDGEIRRIALELVPGELVTVR